MLKIQENISLKEYTTFKVGGKARYFVKVKNLNDLNEAINFVKEKNLIYFVLGGGANILLSDSGFNGLVIKNEILGREIEEIEGGVLLTVGGGENWDELVKFSVDNNLYGLENLSGIPGTVGGMVVQNAGAYGVETKDLIYSVEVFNTETAFVEKFDNRQSCFSYRSSFFKNTSGKKYIIISATFLLKIKSELNFNYSDFKKYFTDKKITVPNLNQMRNAVLEIRSKKMPDLSEMGCAGSFFRNLSITPDKYAELKAKYEEIPGFPEQTGNIKVPLAWILDHVLNLNGYREGNIGLHENQPLVLVNYGEASCDDVLNFAEKIKKIVKEKIGVEIEWEVEKI